MTRTDSERGLRIRQFFEMEASALAEKFRIVEALIPSSRGRGSAHKGEEGRYIEALMRDFLNRHLPSQIRAVSGFILLPSTKTGADNSQRVELLPDRHARQLDIIIFDFANYPVYERSEEFCIVPPEGVVAVVSVKKTLRISDISQEISSLKEVSQLCSDALGGAPVKVRLPFTSIFAFDASSSVSAAKVFSRMQPMIAGIPFDHMVTEVSVFRKYTIFKFNPSLDGTIQFRDVDCRGEGHVSLQRILQSTLSVYYDPSRRNRVERPGFVSFQKGKFVRSPVLGRVPYARQ